MDITSDDPRPPSPRRGVRPASPADGEAGPAGAASTPPWLDLPDEDAPRRRRWVLAAAVLPWVVLGLLVARTPSTGTEPVGGPAAPSPAGAPAPTSTPPAPGASTSPVSVEPGGATVITTRLTGGREAIGLADVAAVAIPVVRAWLGASEPLRIAGIESREYGWVEHAVVEAVDHPGEGAAVASTLVVVLPTDGEGWLEPEVLRVAVPLRILDGQVRPAGNPWLLPPPNLEVAPFEHTPVAEPHDLDGMAGIVLAEMYGQVDEIHGFFSTRSWPLVADVTIRDPLDGTPRRQQIWIRATPTSFPIAGWFSSPPAGLPGWPTDATDATDPSPTPDPEPPSTEEPT